MDAVLILGGLAALAGLYLMLTYNRLVLLRNRVKEAWSGVEVQMKRRYDLIPNLVESVKGYARHEAQTLERAVQARQQAIAATGTPAEQAAAERQLAGAVNGLLALAESYPELKANSNFVALQDALTAVEQDIEAARRYYNGATRDLNVKTEQFPSNLVANAFGFGPADFFDLGAERAEASQPVKVAF